MSALRRLRPTPAMVVALIALAVALGGTAAAVTGFDGRGLVNRSVPAVKIKRNALGGVEINEARLGRVPRAAAALRADTATSAASATSAAVASSAVNAERLGGLAPSAFALGGSRIVEGTLALGAGAAQQPLLVVPGVGTVLATCAAGPAGTLELRNESGGTLNLVGASTSGVSTTLTPNAPDVAAGAVTGLASARAAGVSTLTAWSTDRALVATIVVANTLCRFGAQAVAHR